MGEVIHAVEMGIFGKTNQLGIGNYGLVIILLVLVLKLVLLPLSYKSYLSMAKMRVMKPETDALKEKYPNIPKISTIHSEVISLENPVINDSIKKYICIRPEIQKHIVDNFNVVESDTEVIYNPIFLSTSRLFSAEQFVNVDRLI